MNRRKISFMVRNYKYSQYRRIQQLRTGCRLYTKSRPRVHDDCRRVELLLN